jgi:hypothetical protein
LVPHPHSDVIMPNILQRDNAKSEMSQRVQQIQRDLDIADQLTELLSSCQNPAILNAAKYLNSNA